MEVVLETVQRIYLEILVDLFDYGLLFGLVVFLSACHSEEYLNSAIVRVETYQQRWRHINKGNVYPRQSFSSQSVNFNEKCFKNSIWTNCILEPLK